MKFPGFSAKRSRQRAPQNRNSTPSCTCRCLLSADTDMPQTGSLRTLLTIVMQCSAFPSLGSLQNTRVSLGTLHNSRSSRSSNYPTGTSSNAEPDSYQSPFRIPDRERFVLRRRCLVYANARSSCDHRVMHGRRILRWQRARHSQNASSNKRTRQTVESTEAIPLVFTSLSYEFLQRQSLTLRFLFCATLQAGAHTPRYRFHPQRIGASKFLLENRSGGHQSY